MMSRNYYLIFWLLVFLSHLGVLVGIAYMLRRELRRILKAIDKTNLT